MRLVIYISIPIIHLAFVIPHSPLVGIPSFINFGRSSFPHPTPPLHLRSFSTGTKKKSSNLQTRIGLTLDRVETWRGFICNIGPIIICCTLDISIKFEFFQIPHQYPSGNLVYALSNGNREPMLIANSSKKKKKNAGRPPYPHGRIRTWNYKSILLRLMCYGSLKSGLKYVNFWTS